MNIKLIATDMDGTFLNDEKTAPEENIRALEACAARGIEIVPATGRTIFAIPDEIKNLPGVRYAITTNGAMIVDLQEGTVISSCRMSRETAVKIMEMARDCEDDIMYDAYVEGIGYTSEYFWEHLDHYATSPGIAGLIRKTRRAVPDHIAYVRECGTDIEKINLFFVDMEARARMRERLLKMPEISVTSAIPENLEINAAGASKGGALLRLADYLGIHIEETMAFGDGENDLSMIQTAGCGVAMGNAEELVKASADYITATNNQAGVAAAIQRFILG